MKLPIKIRALIHALIQFSFIGLLAWYYNNYLQMLVIVVLFFIYKNNSEKFYDASTFTNCTICTIITFYFVTMIAANHKQSIIFSILITYIVTGISYRVQDYLDLQKLAKKLNERKEKTNRQRILELVENDEDKIEDLCKKYALINMSETVYLYLNNTREQVAEILNIDLSTVRRRIKRFLKTIEK